MKPALLSMLVFLAPITAFAGNASLCEAGEQRVFDCQLKGGKTASICASPDLAPGKGYLQYRFGKPGKVELALPRQKQGLPEDLRLTHSRDESAEYSDLDFTNDHYRYELTSFRQYQTRNRDGSPTPHSSDSLFVDDMDKTMHEGNVAFAQDCRVLMDKPMDVPGLGRRTGVTVRRGGF